MSHLFVSGKLLAVDFTFIFYGIGESSPEIIDSARSKEVKRKKWFRMKTKEAHEQCTRL